MDARVILKPETANQESNTTKILKWMQEHPNACKNTSCPRMARMMARDFGTQNSVHTVLVQLIRKEVIRRMGNTKNANFSINYLHNKVSPEIREKASEEDKKFIQEVLAQVSEQTKLSEDGCLVRRIEEEQPKEEKETEENKQEEVPIQMERVETTSEDGKKNITITINITI